MAIEKIVEIKVDAKQATKSLQDLGGSFEDVYGEVQPLSGRIGELEDRLYEMSLAGESGTKEFKDLTREIGSMKKVIIDTDRTVDGMSQTMAQNLGGALGGVTAAFELGAGAMGAMGVESEKVEEALLKVQSASAIASGFQGLKESVSSFRALGAAIKASTVVQKVLNGVTLAYNVIMNLNPIAAIITSIVLLISGITALIMNFKAIMSFLGLIDDEQETLHKNQLARNREAQAAQDKKLKELAKEKEELGKKHSFQERLMKAQGKSEEEIFQAIRKNRLERIKASEEFAIQTQIKNDLLIAEAKLLQANGDLTKEELDRINAVIAENNKIIVDSNNERRALAEEIRLEDVAKTTAAENKKTEAVKQANEKQAEIRKKAQEKKEAAEQAAREKEKAEREKEIADEKARLEKQAQDQAELLAQISQLEDEYLNSKISKEQQEINAVNDKYFATLEAARLAGEETFLLEEAQQQAILDIQKRYADEKKALDKELDDKKKETAEAELLREQALQDAKLSLASESLGAISNLVNTFAGKSEESQKRAFKITKAMNIAQAVMDTYKGANAIFASAAANPSTILFPAQPFITAGIAIASGLANVATIARQEFQGGSSTGGGGGGGGVANAVTAMSAPANFNVVGNTGTNQLADTLGSSPMKAYVVAGDVTSAQSLERNKIQQSTI
jgi:hypothetical protein